MAPLVTCASRCLGLIKKYVVPQKSIAIFSCILIASLSVVGFVVFPGVSDASWAWLGLDSVADGVGSAILALLVGLMQLIAKLFMQLAVFFLSFFIAIAKYNNYIDADVVILGWGMVRDVANMFFIVVLMVIAFATILGLESYAWKKTLGKFILMAILVNFSNLIFQLIIDLAHVFTLTFANAIAATAGGNLIAIFNMDKLLSISQTGQVFTGGASQVGNMLTTTFPASVMVLVMAAVSMLTIGLYCIIMLMRMVMLWVLMILSPLAFIMNILPQTKSYASGIWKEFIGNVLAAPVMVFFLWLAFAALGSGSSGAPVPASGPESFGISISEAGTYENLANFCVAIAFMFVGIKKVQETGVVGGGMASTATRFAGNVATIASGYALGRKIADSSYKGAVGLGYKGIKTAAYKAPLVGGARIKQAATGVSSKFSIRSSKRKEARAQKSKDAERVLREGGTPWQKLKAGAYLAAWQPTERIDKQTEDWKDAAERANKVMKENLGTSKTKAGQAKLTQTVRINIQDQVGAVKKEQKLLQKMEELGDYWDEAPGDTDEQKRAAVAKAAGDENIGLAAYELFGKESKIQTAVIKGRASLENVKQKQDRKREVDVARARDEEQRTGTLYQDAVRANHAKQDEERYGAGSWDRMSAYMDVLTEEVRTRMRGDKRLSPDEIEENQRRLSSIVSYQMSTGSTMGGNTVDKLAKAAGFRGDIVAGNTQEAVAAQQRQVLSAILGRDVDVVAEGLASLEAIHGDNFDAFMERLNTNLNKAGADGAPTYAGLFRKEFRENGESAWKANNANDQTDQEYLLGKREYGLRRANFRTMTGLGGLVDRNGGDLNIAIESDAAINNVAAAFSGVTANVANSIQQETIDDFQKLLQTASAEKLNQLFGAMRGVTDEAGLKAMLKRIDKTNGDVTAKIAQLSAENKRLFNAVQEDVPAPAAPPPDPDA